MKCFLNSAVLFFACTLFSLDMCRRSCSICVGSHQSRRLVGFHSAREMSLFKHIQERLQPSVQHYRSQVQPRIWKKRGSTSRAWDLATWRAVDPELSMKLQALEHAANSTFDADSTKDEIHSSFPSVHLDLKMQ